MAGADEVERVYTREELREQQREWHARRPETGGLPPLDPDDEDDARPEAEDEPEGRLRGRWRAALYLGMFAVWALAMLAFGVAWWDFEEHGPWLTPVTPFLLSRAAEQALLRRWPHWEREHDPSADAEPRDAVERMGDRVRPRWAREQPDDPDLSDRTRPSP